MRRIFITIEYKGTSYKGWQIQHGLSTIQGELTIALEKVCGHKINLVGSGRTDEGVHALAQTAHFDCDCTIPDNKFPYCCNVILPPDIKILSSIQVADNFHARFNAKKKTYLYKMYLSDICHPLRDELYAQAPNNLDVQKMQDACNYLVGKQDFTSFMAAGSTIKTTVREIYSASIIQKEDELYFEICGKGFLRNMVRIIAGTLIDISRGKIFSADLPVIIESKKRKLCGYTAPACGLYLKDVQY